MAKLVFELGLDFREVMAAYEVFVNDLKSE